MVPIKSLQTPISTFQSHSLSKENDNLELLHNNQHLKWWLSLTRVLKPDHGAWYKSGSQAWIADWVLWNGLGLNWVLKLNHEAFMDQWRQQDWFGWWVGLDSWVMYRLLVGVVHCCETPNWRWFWIGLDSRVVNSCWKVLWNTYQRLRVI